MTDRPSDHTADWHAMVGFGESHDEFAELGEALTAGGPPPDGPSPLATAPLIIDTDLGGDPDDAFALAVAALTVAELALVITTDEAAGERARFARYLLDLLGRPEVPVVSGADPGNTRYFCVEGLAPAAVGRSRPTSQPPWRRCVPAQGRSAGSGSGPSPTWRRC